MSANGTYERYCAVRAQTSGLCAGLALEDLVVQPMPEASPGKWHLGHTTWFFETFVLQPHLPHYKEHNAAFGRLFNSYYRSLDRDPIPQARRGAFSRPTVEEILEYRRHVDTAMSEVLRKPPGAELREVIELGLQHEQQHQELLVTDLKAALCQHPYYPSYRQGAPWPPPAAGPLGWLELPGGSSLVGHDGVGFSFDNEAPRHAVVLAPFALARRPVLVGEWLEFIHDGGYARPEELWHDDGWAVRQQQGWEAPGYWVRDGRDWFVFTSRGLQAPVAEEPVTHLSYYEACAYAEWVQARLPTEQEWEHAARTAGAGAGGGACEGAFLEDGVYHPVGRVTSGELAHLLGEVWEWTQSDYAPYPGYRRPEGPLGEYNSKFMINQRVVRGGSCATPRSAARVSYRNFLHPERRWQFTGVRLCRDLS